MKVNIAYGKEEVTDKEIIKAAQAAYADHFIRTLPEDGYEILIEYKTASLTWKKAVLES